LEPQKWFFWKPFSRTRIDFFIRIMIDFGKVRGVNVCDLLILNHLFSYLLWCFGSKLCFFRKSSIMGRFWKKLIFFKFFGQNQNLSNFRNYSCDLDPNGDFETSKMMNYREMVKICFNFSDFKTYNFFLTLVWLTKIVFQKKQTSLF
jgi:hypothetical protein